MVERDRAERDRARGDDRRADGDPGEPRLERGAGGEAGEHGRAERDRKRAVADADRLLEPEDAHQERRVLLEVADRVARERHARGEGEQPDRDERDRVLRGAAALQPEHEGGEDEREQHHQVALLETVGAVGRVERRLGEEPEQQADGERGEPALLARARLPEGEHDPDDRARDEREAGRVGEQHRVGAEPVRDLAGLDVQVGDARVVAEQPLRARARRRRRAAPRRAAPRAGSATRPSRTEPRSTTSAAATKTSGRKTYWIAREGREHRERGEAELQPARGLGERADADVDRAEHERVGDRVGEQERREEEVGRGDGQGRRREGRHSPPPSRRTSR